MIKVNAAFGNEDREYARGGALPDWLKEFAEKELKQGTSPFEAIKDLFRGNDLNAVEARVEELREKVGLNNLDKIAADKIKGGFGDNQPDKRYDKDQVDKGIKIEMEHTEDPETATEIVKDHLEETKDYADGKGVKYYDKLEEMENKFKKELVKKKSELIEDLVSFADELEFNGKKDAAEVIDKCILRLSNEMNQMVSDEEPEVFKKHEGIKKHIDNICKSREGHIDAPALMQIILSRPEKLTESERSQVKEYIKNTIKKNKELLDVAGEDDVIGLNEITVFDVDDIDDGNTEVFSQPSKV